VCGVGQGGGEGGLEIEIGPEPRMPQHETTVAQPPQKIQGQSQEFWWALGSLIGSSIGLCVRRVRLPFHTPGLLYTQSDKAAAQRAKMVCAIRQRNFVDASPTLAVPHCHCNFASHPC
jgi:hypothetical protein